MIPLSPVQLKQHIFAVVNVRANPSGTETGKIALDQNLVCVPHAEKPNHWHLELIQHCRSVDPKHPFFYEVEIHVVGVFEITEDVPPEKRETVAAINGLSILYGAAREMVLNITARSNFGQFCLPVVNFAEVLKQSKPGPLPKAAEPANAANTSD